MKDIRCIYLFYYERLIFKKIFTVIESELEATLGKEYNPLPDDTTMIKILEQRREQQKNIYIYPKEVEKMKFLEETLNKKSKTLTSEEVKKEEYPIKEKLSMISDFLFEHNEKTYCTHFIQKGGYTLFVFPSSPNLTNIDPEELYQRVISNSNLYASAQFGTKLIDFVSLRGIHDSTIGNLELILLNCIPFGRICNDDFEAYYTVLCQEDEPSQQNPYIDQKNPFPVAQEKIVSKGQVKKLVVTIQEAIICYQFGRDSIEDIHKVEGSIECHVDSVSEEEISLTLTNLKERILNNLILDLNGSLENSLLPDTKNIKLDFLIPNHKRFRVCHYGFNRQENPPILGSYQRKQISESAYKIRIKIEILKQYQEYIRNLRVQLRLDPTKSILNTQLIADEGNVEVIGNKLLVWSIPDVINAEDNDICLSGDLELSAVEGLQTNQRVELKNYMEEIKNINGLSFSNLNDDDIIFSMPEKFVQVEFEIPNYLISEIDINTSYVSIFPTRKLDCMVRKYTQTRKFFIFLDEDWDTFDFTNHIQQPIDKNSHISSNILAELDNSGLISPMKSHVDLQ